MKVSTLSALAAALTLACAHAPRPAAPLEREGEVWVYLEPFPGGAERLAFTVGQALAERADGTAVPLAIRHGDLSARDRAERLVAAGRLPPGSYVAVLLQIARASLAGEGGRADLLPPKAPVRVELPFAVRPREAAAVALSLRYGASVGTGFSFTPAFGAAIPARPPPQIAGFASASGSAAIFELDLRARRVAAVLPTAGAPAGLALDDRGGRLYVALPDDDAVQVLDAYVGDERERIPLRPGDGPRELALLPDGRTLLVANAGSATASFVDVATRQEVSRVGIGEDPVQLLLDRAGRRAYVPCRRSASVAVLDLATRTLAATVRTEAEPVRAQLSRDGGRLFVAHAASPYLLAIPVPDFSLPQRIAVGIDASALQLDPRTDLLYVGRRDEDALRLYDPRALVPVAYLELPGWASRAAIDDAQNLLFALLPGRPSVVAVDLAGARAVAEVDVGDAPYQIVIAGERR